jgi:hypothetical protein
MTDCHHAAATMLLPPCCCLTDCVSDTMCSPTVYLHACLSGMHYCGILHNHLGTHHLFITLIRHLSTTLIHHCPYPSPLSLPLLSITFPITLIRHCPSFPSHPHPFQLSKFAMDIGDEALLRKRRAALRDFVLRVAGHAILGRDKGRDWSRLDGILKRACLDIDPHTLTIHLMLM